MDQLREQDKHLIWLRVGKTLAPPSIQALLRKRVSLLCSHAYGLLAFCTTELGVHSASESLHYWSSRITLLLDCTSLPDLSKRQRLLLKEILSLLLV